MPPTTYPTNLKPEPDAHLTISLGDLKIPVLKTSPRFIKPTSHKLGDRFGGKPVVRYDGTSIFAEVAILRMLDHAGWEGRWIETYSRPSMDPLVLKTWVRGSTKEQTNVEIGSPHVRNMLHEIARRNLWSYAGCWDVVGWEEDQIVFFESKHFKKDRIRKTQTKWLLAGLDAGLSLDNFVVVEWDYRDV
jgi:hypothetical protein